MSHNVGKLIVFLSLIFSLTIFASAQTGLTINQINININHSQQIATMNLRGEGISIEGQTLSFFYRSCSPCSRRNPPGFDFPFTDLQSAGGWIDEQYYERLYMIIDINVRRVSLLPSTWIKTSSASAYVTATGAVKAYRDVNLTRLIFTIPVNLKGKAFVRLNRYEGGNGWLFSDTFLSYDLFSEQQNNNALEEDTLKNDPF